MRRLAAVAVLLALLASGCAVAPPAAPADPTTVAVAAQAPAAAPGPRVGLFGRIRKTPEQRAQCWADFAKSPLGQMVNNLLKPLAGLTGGILGPVGANDPAKKKLPADSAGGAAAKIQADAAEAKAKIADLEFLAKQDCRRYPEAEAAILNALRAEKIECVRWAAAKALLSGCCCTPKVMKALTVVVNMSDKDGNLAEDSERVRLTALLALEKCLQTCQPKAEEPPEKPAPKEKAEGDVAAVKYEAMTEADIFAAARAAVAKGVATSGWSIAQMNRPANLRDMVFGPQVEVPPTPPPADLPATPPKDRSLTGLFREALGK